MILSDFRCEDCESVFEEMVEGLTICPICQSRNTTRIYTGLNFSCDGTDPGFPTAWDQWAKKREKKMAQERKLEE